MNFNDLDSLMRVYEESSDQCVLPNMYMIARLDGNGFTKLTKRLEFNKPFDSTFNLYMGNTVEYLMKETGFTFLYGYHQSDEISLLFSFEENTFKRKLRKLNSILASKASGFLSLQLNTPVAFDCRISQLPNKELVQDYFSWRQSDSKRNALYSLCYWSLRSNNMSSGKATSRLHKLNNEAKLNLLESEFQIDFQTNIESWKRLGTGYYFDSYFKEGFNPKTNKKVRVARTKLVKDKNLFEGSNYRLYIEDILNG